MAYAAQPTSSGQTLIYDGSALTVGLTYNSTSEWQSFGGIAWKTAANTVNPWYFTYASYDFTGGSGNDIFADRYPNSSQYSSPAPFLGAGDDRIDGGPGDDIVVGIAAGRDTLIGGSGNDSLTWSWTTSAPLLIDLSQTTIDVGGTLITGFETLNLTTGSGNDTLLMQNIASATGGSFSLGAGDDLVMLDNTARTLSLNMGDGYDTLVANLATSSQVSIRYLNYYPGQPWYTALTTAEGLKVTLSVDAYYTAGSMSGPERLVLTAGSGNDDLSTLSMIRGIRSAELHGGAGDDVLGTTAGDDVLDGGDGTDTVIITSAAEAPIRLGVTTPQRSAAGFDTLLNIENLTGSGWLIGDGGANVLTGRWTSDRLEGGDGDDTLYGDFADEATSGYTSDDVLLGGAGNDSLFGRYGRDILAGGSGANTVDGGSGIDTLVIGGARHAGSLTMSNGTSQLISGVIISAFQGSYDNGAEATSFLNVENITFIDGRLVRDPTDPAMQIARMYEAALHRAADPYTFNYWVGVRQSGTTMQQIGDTFAASPEFNGLYGGLDNTGYVTALFNHVLNRAPDTSSLNTWVNALNSGMSRGTVLSRFSESAEFANRFQNEIQTSVWDQDEGAASIARLYQATLGRHPEEYGLISWRGRMDDGLSLYDIVPGFLNSAEFQAIYGATTNEQFVTLLYNNVLGRGPDAEGFAHWTSRLDQGIESRVQVVIGFSESMEFRQNTMSWIEGGIVLA
ncbi:DUF4214 domain-containing protein [Rhodovarius crocodyli]|uniref:DUF4214 domain-containing protein n=1 Tax=Rhodovarius crocodyli TaxID=1979269 RepID=A0A437M404_9PROT|nr:DUF4214 domain-containing protein [Rhodovarius crocodyli]RVT92293.1 DUF4214 domain-containing protein [Rhodovarius crocodyli]